MYSYRQMDPIEKEQANKGRRSFTLFLFCFGRCSGSIVIIKNFQKLGFLIIRPEVCQCLPQRGVADTVCVGKKTEKREIVQLTDDYIKNLENYLNSQDKEVRLMGGKEVIARLEEDHSRKDDKALNALVNKMLQDPYTPVKILALSALDSRVVTGDDYTVGLLKQMQNSSSGYGQDALQATNILLKMSGKKVEKEFEVKDTKKTENKTEKKQVKNEYQYSINIS